MAGGGGGGGCEREKKPCLIFFLHSKKTKKKNLSDNIFTYKLQPLIYIQYHENPFKLIGVTCIPMADGGSNEIKIPDTAF